MRILVLLALAGCQPKEIPAPPDPHGVSYSASAGLGMTFQIASKVLGETRTFNVYLPPDYGGHTAAERYPVLYMPDGGMKEDFPHVVGAVDVSIKNGIIRPIIVVGIENTERRRDLAPPTDVAEEKQNAPKAGGTVAFRAFLRDELMPYIARRFPTSDEAAIIGESLAGLFVLETFVDEPALFDGYIAVDPSVWWNEKALVRAAGPKLAWMTAPARLYVATASYDETNQALAVLTTALRIHAPPGVTWVHEPMPDEQHHTIYPRAALRGIRWLFARPDPE